MGGAGLDAVSFYASRRVALMASRRLARIPRVPRRVDVRRTNPPPRRRRAPHVTPDAGDRQPQVRQGAGLRPLVAAEGRQPRLQGQVVPAPGRQPGLQGPLGAAQDPEQRILPTQKSLQKPEARRRRRGRGLDDERRHRVRQLLSGGVRGRSQGVSRIVLREERRGSKEGGREEGRQGREARGQGQGLARAVAEGEEVRSNGFR